MPVSYQGNPGDGARRGMEAVAKLMNARETRPGVRWVVRPSAPETQVAPLVDGAPAAADAQMHDRAA